MGLEQLSYSLRLCETGTTMPGPVQGRKAIEGMTVYLCECRDFVVQDNRCTQGYLRCGETYYLDLCERGAQCDAPRVSISWTVTADWGDDRVAGDVSWTNPNLGCALSRVQCWIAIPAVGDTAGCKPGGAPTCDWHQIYDREAGGCGECVVYPDGYRNGELQCETDVLTAACAETLGLLGGMEVEVHIDQQLAPGASFWVYGQLGGRTGPWIVLGEAEYQSNGADAGTFVSIGVGDLVTVDRGNFTTKLHQAQRIDYSEHAEGEWKPIMKRACRPDQRFGSNDQFDNESVCDPSTGLWVLPLAARTDI